MGNWYTGTNTNAIRTTWMDSLVYPKPYATAYNSSNSGTFPTIIGEQALDYASKNTFHTVSITWSFRYWKNLTDEADLPKPLQDRIEEILVNTVERKLQSQIPKVLSRL